MFMPTQNLYFYLRSGKTLNSTHPSQTNVCKLFDDVQSDPRQCWLFSMAITIRLMAQVFRTIIIHGQFQSARFKLPRQSPRHYLSMSPSPHSFSFCGVNRVMDCLRALWVSDVWTAPTIGNHFTRFYNLKVIFPVLYVQGLFEKLKTAISF